jgi:hypothetical protein
MWPFGVFLVISSAVAAAAGPIDGPARPAPEVEGAPAPPTEGTGAAAAGGFSEAPRVPIPAQSPEPATRCGQFR